MKLLRAMFAFALLISSYTIFGLTATGQTACSDIEYTFGGTFKPESFFGKNIVFLNSNNCDIDKVWFARHTFDLKLGLSYGKQTFGFPVIDSKFTIRDRGIWGNPESIARTTEATTKVVDTVGRTHKHAIPRHLFWMREGWLSFDLATILGLGFGNQHTFTIGAFPFEVGRGIALGSAYAIGPEILGFYTDYAVDQYAFGAKFSGDIVKDVFHYDLYLSILENKSTSVSETGANILGQQYGRIASPARGFGKINFIVANRLLWHAIDTDNHKVDLETYGVFNHDPEQKVEFLGDASSRLGTIGFAGSYTGDRLEIGFDTAINVGQQRVNGWDRNVIQEKNIDGQVAIVNSHVVSDPNGDNIPFIKNSDAQTLIDNRFEDESQNGQIIGTTAGDVGYLAGPVTLKNKDNRFRNPYKNSFHGWMFVGDLALWFHDHTLRWAIEAGAASGDDNPNTDTKDCRYDGFISLQELYSGNKVKSAFVLGGAGKLRRPLATPESNQSPSQFSSSVFGFTNLVYAGTGLLWTPKLARKFCVNPNIIAYWQEKSIKKFDAQTKKDLDCPASKFLGVETNLFMEYHPVCDMKLYFVGSLFFPGQHYTDIKGKPLDSAQAAALDRLDVTGFDESKIPNLGDNTAWTLNAGIEFKF